METRRTPPTWAVPSGALVRVSRTKAPLGML
ncbi:MAG: hypothetical protein QOE11_1898, partial [Solirubrobacteraceae bacterium]|nr:hypothetical protein [Solirubrobacteraceae bacterium]